MSGMALTVKRWNRLPTIDDFAPLPFSWLQGLTKSAHDREHEGQFDGDIDAWIVWLGEVAPFRSVQNLLRDIRSEGHIGHQELLRFLYRIQRLRMEGEPSLAPVFRELIDQFRTTTNNPNWAKELEDAVRWVIGADWNPLSKNDEKDD